MTTSKQLHREEMRGQIHALLGEAGRIGNELATLDQITNYVEEMRRSREMLKGRLAFAKSQCHRLHGDAFLAEVLEKYKDSVR